MAPKKRKASTTLTHLTDSKKAKSDAAAAAAAAASKKRRIITTERRVTRGMTTDASRKALFNTSELLEHILMQLPMRQLFVIQRVSKQFLDTIFNSPSLKKRMWLLSASEEEKIWTVVGKGERAEFKIAPLGTTLSRNNSQVRRNTMIDDKVNLQPVRMNPILRQLSTDGTSAEYAKSLRPVLAQPEVKLWRLDKSMLEGKSYSISDMLISDPPCRSATLSFECVQHVPDRPLTTADFSCDVDVSSGLTFGNLLQQRGVLNVGEHSGGRQVSTRSHNVSCLRAVEEIKSRDESVKGWKSEHWSIELYGVVCPSEQKWKDMAQAESLTAV